MFDIVCGGPGPHIPPSGVLGECDVEPAPDTYRCTSPACAPEPYVLPPTVDDQIAALTATLVNAGTISADDAASIAQGQLPVGVDPVPIAEPPISLPPTP